MHDCIALSGPPMLVDLSQLVLPVVPLFLGGIGTHWWHQHCVAVHLIVSSLFYNRDTLLLSVVSHLHSCLRPFLTDALNRHGRFPCLAIIIILMMAASFACNGLLLTAQAWLSWLLSLIFQAETIISVFVLGLWRSRWLLDGFYWIYVQNLWLGFGAWPTLLT